MKQLKEKEIKHKLLPAFIGNVKYSKRVRVADVKGYLVDKMKFTRELDKENKELRKKLEDFELFREKYDIILTTLDEYKKRLDDENKEKKELRNTITELKSDLKIMKNDKNTLEIASKKFSKEYAKAEENGYKQCKKDIIEGIDNLHGRLTKDLVKSTIEDIKYKK